MRRTPPSSIQAALFGLVMAWSASASAQVNDKALAESLFQEGRELMKQGATDKACARFEQSQKLEPKIGTLLNVALCHEDLGKTASAWGEFVEVADMARRNKDAAREMLAREHAQALDAKLSRLEIARAGNEADFALTIDGRKLDLVLLGTPIPLDPGKHVVEARAPGHKPWAGEVTMPAGPARSSLRIPALELDAKPLPAPPPPSLPPVAVAPSEPPRTKERGGWPPATWVGFGLGGASGLIGIVAGGISMSQTSALAARCFEGHCQKADAAALSTANDIANVSNVAFGVAAAGIAVGVIALVTAPSRGDGEKSGRALRVVADAAGPRLVF